VIARRVVSFLRVKVSFDVPPASAARFTLMRTIISLAGFALVAIVALSGCASRREAPMSLQERWNRIVDHQDAAARGFVENF
jgi:hypothetical protein